MKKLTLKELNELNKLNSLNKLLKVIELLRHPKMDVLGILNKLLKH